MVISSLEKVIHIIQILYIRNTCEKSNNRHYWKIIEASKNFKTDK